MKFKLVGQNDIELIFELLAERLQEIRIMLNGIKDRVLFIEKYNWLIG